jgi:predicted nucleic acid-binding Zn ribbon protein
MFRPKTLRHDAVYCSRKCKDTARTSLRRASYDPEIIGCHQCGKELAKKRSDARFCSAQCGQVWHNQRRSADKTAARLAAQAPCQACGGAVPPERRVFCSQECMYISRVPNAHGLTASQFDDLLSSQGRSCAICGTSDWGVKGPQIDHNHETGAVRGILCVNCNNALGRFKEDVDVMRRAAEYLERHAETCPSCEVVAAT